MAKVVVDRFSHVTRKPAVHATDVLRKIVLLSDGQQISVGDKKEKAQNRKLRSEQKCFPR